MTARFLLVNTRYRPPNFRGGVERYVHMIATELMRLRFACGVVALEENVACESAVPHQFVRVPRMPLLRPVLFSFLGRGLWKSARAVIVQYTPFGMLVPKEKLICTVHTTGYGEAAALEGLRTRGRWLKRTRRFIGIPFERFVLRRARHVIAISEPVAQELREIYGVDPARISVVGNGVDCEEFVPADRPRSHTSLRVLYVGRLVQRKKVDVLIEAVAAASMPLTLRIVGSGPEEAALRASVERHGLTSRIEFRGFRSGADLRDEYQWADVFAIPSSYEGVPLAALEAKACALPLVAAGFAGAERLATEGSGLLIAGSDAAGFAHAFDWLAGHPDRLRHMGEQARREAVENFSWPAAVSRLVRIYETVT
jgi:glycosyltransferase involved in cell wall biosynthesis